ncbi:hypothetical protein ACFVGY_33920 [Streptomyces sp. NPDC127106]
MDWPRVLLWTCLAYIAVRIAVVEIRSSRARPRATGEGNDGVADEA